MKKILYIASSIRGENSFSNKLAQGIIEKLQAENPGAQVHTRDLAETPHLEGAHLAALSTAPEQRTAEQNAVVKYSDEAIAELFDGDIVVIGVPVYNFGIPSVLKAWIDQIARAGVTFRYSEAGPEGLVKNKKVYLAIASGAVFSEGDLKALDFAEPYLRGTLGFLGLTDIETFRVEGTAIPGISETALPKALQQVGAHTFAAAGGLF